MKSTKTRLAAFVMAFALVCSSVFAVPEMTQAATKAKKITVSSTKKTVYVGKSFNLKVKKVTPSKASKNVTYKTSNKQIATVTSKGKVTGKKAGKAVITVTSKTNKKATAKCTVTVKQQVKSIQTASEMVMKKGKSASIKYSVLPANAASKKVKFKSSKPSVVSVDKKGKLKAKKEGSATIEVKSEDGFAKAKIKVTVKKKITEVSKIKLNKKSTELTIGKTEKLKATVSPSKATSKKVYWVSSNPKAVTVDKNGKVKAVAAGTAKVTAYATDNSGKSASCTVKAVKPQPKPTPKPPVTGPDDSNTDNSKPDTDNSKPDDTKPPVNPEGPTGPTEVAVTSVTLNLEGTVDLKANKELQLTAEVAPKNATNKNVTWSSSDTTVATVADGKVTPLKAGTVTITATAGGKKDSCTVNVVTKANAKSETDGFYQYTLDKEANFYLVEREDGNASVDVNNVAADRKTFAEKAESYKWNNDWLDNYWSKMDKETLKALSSVLSIDGFVADGKWDVTVDGEAMNVTVGAKKAHIVRTGNNLEITAEGKTAFVNNIDIKDVENGKVEVNADLSGNSKNAMQIRLIFAKDGSMAELTKKANEEYLTVMTLSDNGTEYLYKLDKHYYNELLERFAGLENVVKTTTVSNEYTPIGK